VEDAVFTGRARLEICSFPVRGELECWGERGDLRETDRFTGLAQ
jgi:hypothetical protein